MSDFFVGLFCFFCQCYSYKKFEDTRRSLCEAKHIIRQWLSCGARRMTKKRVYATRNCTPKTTGFMHITSDVEKQAK